MQLAEFNQASESDAKSFLKHCVQIKSWVSELTAQRPYASVEDLLIQAKQQTKTWQWSEIKSALDNHPRIGEKQAQATLSDQEQDFSKREQASITSDDATQEALLAGNTAYEKKYGYIFLIKASGLNSEDVLQALRYRLMNDPDTEKRIVHQQLTEIALLRLTQELNA
ncbi:2-oxo-4-hydroxy-4-carboxy-5-ureidoimidazoline decarboxylase [Acinetobacter cumulans]|uniref:2-oxo-4-hydroxy-4-carboxy-5-ureidoimidazoline decarboxylase n=1 Tax=Acinetobacter cumulans TaxID=2136182 RepID=A0A498D003_9GAMM|nr:2-oxo-4-hydroxy-4-carboxy-5-ureidoimidazoline decarboxylase [Acinetobacter cumulans]RLL37600.1 2-oxo-4-hydroxy-4-carboxy-5-ureidoimidazoline decarboxylase [Acinetobacter cumulans]